MSSYVAVVAEQLLPVVGVIVASVGGVLATWLARLVARKLKIEITATVEGELERLTVQAVGYAEQWAHARLRQGDITGGPAKLQEALKFALREAERRNLPAAAREEITDLLEAALGVRRIANTGAAIPGATTEPDHALPPGVTP